MKAGEFVFYILSRNVLLRNVLLRNLLLFLILFRCSILSCNSNNANSNNIDAYIVVSSEDEKYNIKGGIGTYLSILTKEVKKHSPNAEVYWIAKSPNQNDFTEVDKANVTRHYLSGSNYYKDKPFFKHIDDSKLNNLVSQQVFINKVNSKVGEILDKLKDKKVVIECGEWEGLAHQLFRVIKDKNILKAARLHSPLVSTMIDEQNQAQVPVDSAFQLMHEFEVIENADCITSSSAYIKNLTLDHLIGRQSNSQIKVIPNPINTQFVSPKQHNRQESIQKINGILKRDFLSKDSVNIFMIGRVETRKGADLVMKAIPEIAQKIPEARFVFFGNHKDDKKEHQSGLTLLSPEELLKTIPEKFRDKVEFGGCVPYSELPSILSAGDLFPIMYLGDNFPGVVTELALLGKPMLALSRGGVTEMLTDNSGNFVAYNLGESLDTASQNLSKGVIELYSDAAKKDSIAKNTSILIKTKYDPALVVNDLMAFYSNCLDKKLS